MMASLSCYLNYSIRSLCSGNLVFILRRKQINVYGHGILPASIWSSAFKNYSWSGWDLIFASDSCQGYENLAHFSWVEAVLRYNLHSRVRVWYQATLPMVGDFSWNDMLTCFLPLSRPVFFYFGSFADLPRSFDLVSHLHTNSCLRICVCRRWPKLIIALDSY